MLVGSLTARSDPSQEGEAEERTSANNKRQRIAAAGLPPRGVEVVAACSSSVMLMTSQRRSPRGAQAVVLVALVLSAAAGVGAGSIRPLDGSRRSLEEISKNAEYASDRVIVSFKTDVVVAMAAEEEGLQFMRPAGQQGSVVYSITDGADVADKIKQLEHHPAVAMVEPDYKVFAQWTNPDDTNINLQWHHPVIGSEKAWDVNTGSDVVKVCHVDSGVRVDHPDLAGNVLKGWNFVPAGQVEGTPPPRAGTPDYFNYNDTYGHGTHTAGIIGGIGNNRLGIAGINWRVKMLVCRFIWNDGSGYVSDAMNCIKLCNQEGAMITSNSWGGIGYSSFLEREIATSQSAGQLFVVASGNSGINLDDVPLYPTSYKSDNMISVASSGQEDFVSSFSNIGLGTVHMLAPGEAIYSTFMDGGYKLMWGTSMACPMVAGTAALLQAQAMSRGVTLGYADLKSLILNSVDKVADGADKTITGGRLNVSAAMTALGQLLVQRGAITPVSLPTASPPPPPRPPAPRPPPAGGAVYNGGTSLAFAAPVCGTSPLRGLNSATQSSTVLTYQANHAIDGECKKRRLWQGSCSRTKLQENPWWAVKLPARKSVLGVSLQTGIDCGCVSDLQGTQIWVGSAPWTSPASAANFTLCATVPGIARGQRRTFSCALGVGGAPPSGQYIAVLRPTAGKKALTLCEVDAVYGPNLTLQSVRQPARGLLGQLQAQLGAAAAAVPSS